MSVSKIADDINVFLSVETKKSYVMFASVIILPVIKFLHAYFVKGKFLSGTRGFVESVEVSMFSFITNSDIYISKGKN